jgi:hypothetical protein
MERSYLERMASGVNALGAGAIVFSSGWFACKVFDVIGEHGLLSAVGILGLFILTSAMGLAITRSIDRQ